MNYVGSSNRSRISFVIFLSLLLMVSGCSHRAVHGTSNAHKAKKMNVHATEDNEQLSSLDGNWLEKILEVSPIFFEMMRLVPMGFLKLMVCSHRKL